GALSQPVEQAGERRLAALAVDREGGGPEAHEVLLGAGVALLPEAREHVERAVGVAELVLEDARRLPRHARADRRMRRVLGEPERRGGERLEVALLAGEPLDRGVDRARLRGVVERFEVGVERRA